jgi:hypothetical protein
VNQELAEADNRFLDHSRPCTPTSLFIPPVPSQDHETVQLPQEHNDILSGSPRPHSGLSYVTVEVQQHPPECQDGGRQESAISYASGTLPTSTMRVLFPSNEQSKILIALIAGCLLTHIATGE